MYESICFVVAVISAKISSYDPAINTLVVETHLIVWETLPWRFAVFNVVQRQSDEDNKKIQ